MRYIALCILLSFAPLASANDDVAIDIHIGSYPRLVAVPGYPVYYDPYIPANYFFYDGLYWVFANDGWYESHWYNGPWHYARPEYVPYYVLRVPVRYYRRPPPYFAGWRREAPPRWDEHWGREWQEHHEDWNHWDRHAEPPLAPLPTYQRHYSGSHYPTAENDQHALRQQNYHYEPRDEATRSRWQQQDERADDRGQAHGNPHADGEAHGNPHGDDPHGNPHGEQWTHQ